MEEIGVLTTDGNVTETLQHQVPKCLEEEDHMRHFVPVLADGVTIKINTIIWSITITAIVSLIIAIIIGVIATILVKDRTRLGVIGAIITALIGIGVTTQIIIIQGIDDLYLFGLPVIRALIGAIIFVAIWRLIILIPIIRRPSIGIGKVQ